MRDNHLKREQEKRRKMGTMRKWNFFLGKNKRPLEQEFQEKVGSKNILDLFLLT